MSGDVHDINIKTRAANFIFPARQRTEGNSCHSDTNIRGNYTILCYHQRLGGMVKRGDFSTCDAPRPRQPKRVMTPEITDKIHEVILTDHRISAKSTAQQWGISRERVGYIIHEAFREVGPKMHESGSKTSMVPSSEQI
jgi:hypothetical protein